MTDKQMVIDGCEFQSDCIEYKDISYLKIMPICAIHELSIACHDKENKCKYYKLYKQFKRKEQECEKLKAELKNFQDMAKKGLDEFKDVGGCWGCGLQLQLNQDIQDIKQLKAENDELKEKVKELRQGWINCDKERNLQEANSEFRQRVINRYKQTLTEIEEIAEENIRIADLEGLNGVYRRGLAEQILQKINGK